MDSESTRNELRSIRSSLIRIIGHAGRKDRMILSRLSLEDDLSDIGRDACEALEKTQLLIDGYGE